MLLHYQPKDTHKAQLKDTHKAQQKETHKAQPKDTDKAQEKDTHKAQQKDTQTAQRKYAHKISGKRLMKFNGILASFWKENIVLSKSKLRHFKSYKTTLDVENYVCKFKKKTFFVFQN